MSTTTEQHAALFDEYRATGTVELRNRLADAYLPLVKRVAERMSTKLPAEVELNDLIQAGSLGLLDAIRDFDPSRRILFSTFAQYRIWGAIMDWLREIDWVPRLVRERIRRLRNTLHAFEGAHGRLPTPQETRDLLPGDERFVRMVYHPPVVMMTTLNAPVIYPDDGSATTHIDTLVDHREQPVGKEFEDCEAFDRIISVVLQSSVSDALLLRMHYREGITLQRCGFHLGRLSESSMSVRRKLLLKRLRSHRELKTLGDAVREAA